MYPNVIKSDKTIVCSQIKIDSNQKWPKSLNLSLVFVIKTFKCVEVFQGILSAVANNEIIDNTNMVKYFLADLLIVILLSIDHHGVWIKQSASSSPFHPILMPTNEIGNK